jgi:hypothetical protein
MPLTTAEISAYLREKITCDCGYIISRRSKARHLKSNNHKKTTQTLQDRITELENELNTYKSL